MTPVSPRSSAWLPARGANVGGVRHCAFSPRGKWTGSELNYSKGVTIYVYALFTLGDYMRMVGNSTLRCWTFRSGQQGSRLTVYKLATKSKASSFCSALVPLNSCPSDKKHSLQLKGKGCPPRVKVLTYAVVLSTAGSFPLDTCVLFVMSRGAVWTHFVTTADKLFSNTLLLLQ